MPFLSIDIGSSAVKAAAIGEEGALLGAARREAPLRHRGQAHEADPLEWVEGAASACREIVAALPGIELRAIAVSGNGPTLVAAAADGAPLGPALSWMDRRAKSEAAEVSRLAEMPVDASFYLPKALMLWRGSEDLRRRARWFFSCPEYLAFFLSGEAVTYLPHPGYEPYIWDSSLLGALELPLERFPPFAAPGTRIGSLRAPAAERFGLSPGIPIVAAFPDFLASIVGSATVDVGLACDRGGTSEAINLCATKPFPGRELLSLPHAVPGLWNLSGGLTTAGKALEWLASVIGPRGRRGTAMGADGADATALLAAARESKPGAGGLVFLPYLAGERAPLWDSERRGAFVGLSLSHDRRDLARAVCESIAFGLRHAAEFATRAGFPFDAMRSSGAPARDEFLNSLKADVLGVPVEAPAIPDCELVGDACACSAALGDASGIVEAARRLVRIVGRREPEPGAARRYDELFAAYKEASSALGPVDSLLAAFREAGTGRAPGV